MNPTKYHSFSQREFEDVSWPVGTRSILITNISQELEKWLPYTHSSTMLERWRNEWIVLWHVFFLKFYSQRVVESMCLLILLQNYSATPEKSLSNSFSHRRSQICLNILSSTFFSFPGGSDSKQSACNVGDLGSIPGSGRYPGEGNGPTQWSILAWRIPWTEKPGGLQSMGSQSWTWLSD